MRQTDVELSSRLDFGFDVDLHAALLCARGSCGEFAAQSVFDWRLAVSAESDGVGVFGRDSGVDLDYELLEFLTVNGVTLVVQIPGIGETLLISANDRVVCTSCISQQAARDTHTAQNETAFVVGHGVISLISKSAAVALTNDSGIIPKYRES